MVEIEVSDSNNESLSCEESDRDDEEEDDEDEDEILDDALNETEEIKLNSDDGGEKCHLDNDQQQCSPSAELNDNASTRLQLIPVAQQQTSSMQENSASNTKDT